MRPEPDRVWRRRTYEAGQRAEWIALLWMSLKGYRVLARRYAVRGGEIDLVMRRADTIVFVEVKARPRLADALDAITPLKRRRIGRAAAVWLARHPWALGLNRRGDLIALAPRCWPRHVAGAVPLDGDT